MSGSETPRPAPGTQHGTAPGPSADADAQDRKPPDYDPSKEGYAGISAGVLDDPDAVRAARDFAEMIVDTIREGLLVLDLDLRVKAANESFYRQFGVQPEETLGRLVYDLGDGQWNLPELRHLLEGILPHDDAFNDYEIEHAFEGIGHRVMLLNARRLNDHQLILLAIEDVTERQAGEREQERLRRAEDALAASEAAFLDLAEAMPHLVWTALPDGTVNYYSKQAERYDGIRRRGADSWEWAPVVHRDDVERTTEEWRRAVATGAPYEVEHRLRMADGTHRWHVSRAHPVLDARGHVEQWYGTATDVHRMKEAEAALRENEERLRWAQKAAHVGTWDINLVTGEVTWSEGVFALVGLPPEEGVPSADTWSALLHPADRERVEEQVQAAIASGGSYENEFRIVRPGGEVVWVAAKGQVLRDAAGRPLRLLGANYDVTARKRTEEALRRLNETLEERVEERTRQVRRHQERIRELSRALALAEQEERRRIAHVLHDDLQQVLFGAQIALATGHAKQLEGILDEALTLTRTLSHSLSPPFLEGEDVEDLLRWVAERQEMRYGLAVDVEVRGDVPVPDPALRVLLYQIVRELLFNVAKHAGTKRARLVAERVDGHVRVVVADDGTGFDPAELEETTAVGLGLPSVRERVELVGGTLDVASTPGAGARVTITVPVESASPA